MSENNNSKSDEQQKKDFILDLDFAPDWARSSPEEHLKRYQNVTNEYEETQRTRRRHDGARDRRRPARGYDDGGGTEKFSRRPPRRDPEGRPGEGGRKPFHKDAVQDFASPDTEHAAPRRHHDPQARPYRPSEPPLPVNVRLLPEQRTLGDVIRRIQTTHRAFPLRDLAWLFLNNPHSCLLRIESTKEERINFFQCKVCGLPSLTEDDIKTHLVTQHLEYFFDVEEVSSEPPAGVFVCVARCGLSGTLLGPPNHHSYAGKVQEMLRGRYANMSEEAYRSRIEMVREPDVIEQWRQQCVTQKKYRRKVDPQSASAKASPLPNTESAENSSAEDVKPEPAPSPALDREVAELVFLREILPNQIANVRQIICTLAVGQKTPSHPLLRAIRETMDKERHFPTSLFFALRGAFRHRKLYLFRVNDSRGPEFVMTKAPQALELEHTVPTLRNILTYVNDHAPCAKSDLLKAVVPEGDKDKLRETLIQLAWLTERAHLIHFYNDLLSTPQTHPAFRFLSDAESPPTRKTPATKTAAEVPNTQTTAPPVAPTASPEVAEINPAEQDTPATEIKEENQITPEVAAMEPTVKAAPVAAATDTAAPEHTP